VSHVIGSRSTWRQTFVINLDQSIYESYMSNTTYIQKMLHSKFGTLHLWELTSKCLNIKCMDDECFPKLTRGCFLLFKEVPGWQPLKILWSIVFLHSSIFKTKNTFQLYSNTFSSKFCNFIRILGRNEKNWWKKTTFIGEK